MFIPKVSFWIKEDIERWKAVCGADGRTMTRDEAYQTMTDILKIGKPSSEFMVVLYVLMTRYGIESPAELPEKQ